MFRLPLCRQVGEFGADNRAGIDKTLHRISAIRNRAGKVVGLTCRVRRLLQCWSSTGVAARVWQQGRSRGAAGHSTTVVGHAELPMATCYGSRPGAPTQFLILPAWCRWGVPSRARRPWLLIWPRRGRASCCWVRCAGCRFPVLHLLVVVCCTPMVVLCSYRPGVVHICRGVDRYHLSIKIAASLLAATSFRVWPSTLLHLCTLIYTACRAAGCGQDDRHSGAEPPAGG